MMFALQLIILPKDYFYKEIWSIILLEFRYNLYAVEKKIKSFMYLLAWSISRSTR